MYENFTVRAPAFTVYFYQPLLTRQLTPRPRPRHACAAKTPKLSIGAADRAAGGPRLHATCLSEELFAAAAMQAVRKDLMSMKVTELKEELEARGEPRTGNKAWLRRRLHAAIVRAHLEAVEEEDGM